MLDFEIHRCSRRCLQSDRELKPGEPVYSVLVSRGAQVVRLDYAAEAWPGPPEESIGWWKSAVPDANGTRVQWAPNDVMLHYFEQLEGRDDQRDVRYVLALLMIRRRILRLEESVKDEQGRDLLVVYSPRGERQHRVFEEMPSDERIREIQTELSKLLFDGSTSLPPLESPTPTASTAAAIDAAKDELPEEPTTRAPS